MLNTKKVIHTVITDFDNTLFDWVEVWFQSFSAMVEKIVEISGVSKEVILADIKSVHERHGTSEYAFLLEELSCLPKEGSREELLRRYDPAIHAYRSARKKYLQTYSDVIPTMMKIKESQAKVVVYTESMGYYSSYRLRKLGLDGIVDVLYSPQDHDLPINLSADQLRYYPAENYQFQHTVHRYTPSGHLKPSKNVLMKIVDEVCRGKTEGVIYIGDSLMKDIAMAQSCDVLDVYAKYGLAQHRDQYQLLRAVTHWTNEMVEKEKETTAEIVNPSYTLESSFSEILHHFDFGGENE